MEFRIDPQIFDSFPDVRIGTIVAHGVDNRGAAENVSHLLAEQTRTSQEELAGIELGQDPRISVWRDAYRAFGSKPRDYPSSIESLAKRVAKSGDLRSISPLVDLYNIVSLRYLLPVGGENLDAMEGDLRLTIAGENEHAVVVLGQTEREAPYPGEVIYRDDAGPICRRWNWREVARSATVPPRFLCRSHRRILRMVR